MRLGRKSVVVALLAIVLCLLIWGLRPAKPPGEFAGGAVGSAVASRPGVGRRLVFGIRPEVRGRCFVVFGQHSVTAR